MDKLYRIWLAQKVKVSRKIGAELIEKLGSPSDVYNAGEEEYNRVGSYSDIVIEQLLDKNLDEAERIIKDCDKYNIKILTPECDEFPKALNNLKDPVLVLYVKGQIPDWNSTLRIAVVGTRHNSEYGEIIASRFSQEIAREGVIIVSGMALGIDGIAMRAAINCGGFVIGVMGRGLDEAYPKKNEDIFSSIVSYGCAISEYPPGTGPLRVYFPERNRIVCAISNGVLAVEAPLKSGTMITANLALENGTPLFTVPGNIFHNNSSGTNHLLRNGAVAVMSAEDILEEFPYEYNEIKREREPDGEAEFVIEVPEDSWVDDPIEEEIIKLLKAKDMDIEEIAAASGIGVKELNAHITILEVEGIIQKLAGARYRYNTEI